MQHTIAPISTRIEDSIDALKRLASTGSITDFLQALLLEVQDIKDALYYMEEAINDLYREVRDKDLSRDALRFVMKRLNGIEKVDDARERIQLFQSLLKHRQDEVAQYLGELWWQLVNELNHVISRAADVAMLESVMEDNLGVRTFGLSW